MITTATITPNLSALLEALAVRPRCESDAFAFWLGLNPREENPWSIESVVNFWPEFRSACKSARVRVTGRSLDGFTYHAPSR